MCKTFSKAISLFLLFLFCSFLSPLGLNKGIKTSLFANENQTSADNVGGEKSNASCGPSGLVFCPFVGQSEEKNQLKLSFPLIVSPVSSQVTSTPDLKGGVEHSEEGPSPMDVDLPGGLFSVTV